MTAGPGPTLTATSRCPRLQEVTAFCASRGADMRRFRLAQQAIPGIPQQQLEAEQALGAAGIPRRCALVCVPAAQH